MSPFVVIAVCIQACLVQSVMSQCGCGQLSYGNYGFNGLNTLNLGCGLNLASTSFNTPVISAVSTGSCQSYGGVGTGEVGVAGDIGASGNTIVVGSVPVLGAVDFSGVVPASGSVSISGQCGCGCNSVF